MWWPGWLNCYPLLPVFLDASGYFPLEMIFYIFSFFHFSLISLITRTMSVFLHSWLDLIPKWFLVFYLKHPLCLLLAWQSCSLLINEIKVFFYWLLHCGLILPISVACTPYLEFISLSPACLKAFLKIIIPCELNLSKIQILGYRAILLNLRKLIFSEL